MCQSCTSKTVFYQLFQEKSVHQFVHQQIGRNNMNSKAIKDRLVSLLKDKSSGIQPEFQDQLSKIIKRIEELLRDNYCECEIPDELIKEIARCLIPDIIRFLESDKGKEEFEKWQILVNNRTNKTKSNSRRLTKKRKID